MRLQRAARLDAADTIELALRREDVYDRRWTRHRDQLLTAVGVTGFAIGMALGVPALSALAVLPASPRAAQWLVDLVAATGDAAPARRRRAPLAPRPDDHSPPLRDGEPSQPS